MRLGSTIAPKDWPANGMLAMHMAAISVPIYGTKRSRAANVPQSSACGSFTKYKPTPKMLPYVAFTKNCMSKLRKRVSLLPN